ncbi:MAG: hypothetical protein LBB11_03500 [Puniceicoccales bacterium]|nr:hypothetical protein [Puniceicoccales bacterium]
MCWDPWNEALHRLLWKSVTPKVPIEKVQTQKLAGDSPAIFYIPIISDCDRVRLAPMFQDNLFLC